MMTTLITVLTLILVAIIALWAAWARLRAWIELPKYEVLKQIREYEDAHAKPPSADAAASTGGYPAPRG